MLTQEQFEKIELEHGCGYWNLCAERACPCAITTENKGLQESIYNGFIEENRKLVEEYDNDDFDYEPMTRCIECGCLQNESTLINGVCFGCYNEEDNDNSDLEMDCIGCELGKERACGDCCRDWDNEEDEW